MALLPKNFKKETSGCCMLAAAIMAKKLCDDPNNKVTVVEGWIQYVDSKDRIVDGFKLSHTWVVCNKQILDPTFVQFNAFTKEYFGVHRSISKKYDGAFYAATFPDSAEDVKRYFTDGKVPRYVLDIIQQAVPENEAMQAQSKAKHRIRLRN